MLIEKNIKEKGKIVSAGSVASHSRKHRGSWQIVAARCKEKSARPRSSLSDGRIAINRYVLILKLQRIAMRRDADRTAAVHRAAEQGAAEVVEQEAL